jgi:hypothetical protein
MLLLIMALIVAGALLQPVSAKVDKDYVRILSPSYAEVDIYKASLFYWFFNAWDYAEYIRDNCPDIKENRSTIDVALEIIAHAIGWHIFGDSRCDVAGITADGW